MKTVPRTWIKTASIMSGRKTDIEGVQTMREIKFRAWDKINKKMEEVDGYNLYIADGRMFEIYEASYGYQTYMVKNDVTDKYILMQYTGLKDDTGRETYTKDIYEDLDGKRFMVDFSDGMFTANYPHEDRLIPLIDCLNGSKFVGIYHENPELLKGDENE